MCVVPQDLGEELAGTALTVFCDPSFDSDIGDLKPSNRQSTRFTFDKDDVNGTLTLKDNADMYIEWWCAQKGSGGPETPLGVSRRRFSSATPRNGAAVTGPGKGLYTLFVEAAPDIYFSYEGSAFSAVIPTILSPDTDWTGAPCAAGCVSLRP